MTKFRIEKRLEVPLDISPSTMYVVKSNIEGLADIYFSNNEGNELVHVISRADVTSLINNALLGYSTIKVVQTIDDRDLIPKTGNILVLVLDATQDVTVVSGSAMYLYDQENGNYVKVAEYESMDFNVSWGTLLGKPNSSAADIDSAVNLKHSHSNKSVLDSLGVDQTGNLLLDGNLIKISMSESEW